MNFNGFFLVRNQSRAMAIKNPTRHVNDLAMAAPSPEYLPFTIPYSVMPPNFKAFHSLANLGMKTTKGFFLDKYHRKNRINPKPITQDTEVAIPAPIAAYFGIR